MAPGQAVLVAGGWGGAKAGLHAKDVDDGF